MPQHSLAKVRLALPVVLSHFSPLVHAGGLSAGLQPGRCTRVSPGLRQSLLLPPPPGRHHLLQHRLDGHTGLLQRILQGGRPGVGAPDCLQPGQPDEVQQTLGC